MFCSFIIIWVKPNAECRVERLNRVFLFAHSHSRLNRSAKYYLEKDLRDKFQAERIEEFCSLLSSTTASVEEKAPAGQCADGG